jgi:hypothetical protein
VSSKLKLDDVMRREGAEREREREREKDWWP